MNRRKAAADAISKLWNVDSAASEDEDVCLDDDCEPQVSDEDAPTECSDDNSSESEEIDDIDHETSVICDGFDSSNSSLRAKSGTVWEALKTNQSASQPGRAKIKNIMTVTPGVKQNVKRRIYNPLSAWRFLITEMILKTIQLCTIQKAQSVNVDFTLTLKEIDVFIGILYLRGVLGLRRAPIHSIWSMEFGCSYI